MVHSKLCLHMIEGIILASFLKSVMSLCQNSGMLPLLPPADHRHVSTPYTDVFTLGTDGSDEELMMMRCDYTYGHNQMLGSELHWSWLSYYPTVHSARIHVLGHWSLVSGQFIGVLLVHKERLNKM